MKKNELQHRLGVSILTLAVVFAVLWLLTGCVPTDDAKSGNGIHPTTTTEMVFDHTTTTVAPSTTTAAPSQPDPNYVISNLIDRVPSLDGLTYSDIRSQLLGTVCNVIDESDGDFAEVGDVIVASSIDNFEFDYSDAGAIVAAAVLIQCPEWRDAAQEFANSDG